MTHATNILRFVLDSICFLQAMVYLNNPINNMKIALYQLIMCHIWPKGHICEKPNATYPRNKYFLTYRNVITVTCHISHLETMDIYYRLTYYINK